MEECIEGTGFAQDAYFSVNRVLLLNKGRAG
jgi:hypothetical protein